MSLHEFIETNLDKPSEILFFAGSFNPWHEGHDSCLNKVIDKPVIIIPDHNPFKELIKSETKLSPITELEEKVNSFNKDFHLFTEFSTLNKKNPTHAWIKSLKAKMPEVKLSLLMGFDTFISIDRWINAKELLENLSALYIVNRLNNEKIKQAQVENLSSFKNMSLHFLGEHDYEDLSSTQIRSALKNE